MDGQLVLNAATVALAAMELVKWVLRKFILKNPEYDFPVIYYTLMIPFLTGLAGIGLGLLGWAEPVVFDPQAILQWALAILVELMFYHMGVKPLKDYAKGE